MEKLKFKIPLAKPWLDISDTEQVNEVILSGWITQGPKVLEFEEKFSKFIGSKYAVAVSNCTTALHLALIVSGVGPEHEVICPSLSYIATANAIKYVGAKVVFAEVNQDYNLDFDDVVRKTTPLTKAIILVHQAGMPAQLEEFQSFCSNNNIELIEDAACAIGSKYHGEYIGSNSRLACFSFHPRKVLTTGDGGMICTNDSKYESRLRRLRQHGMDVNDFKRHTSENFIIPQHLEVGYNYRLTDLQAAIGVSQLSKLNKILIRRRQIAKKYFDTLSIDQNIVLPLEDSERESNYQSFIIYIRNFTRSKRDSLIQLLLDSGIQTRPGIMTSHREPAYLNYPSLPFSEDLSDSSICLPIYVPMEDEEIDFVSKTFLNCLSKCM